LSRAGIELDGPTELFHLVGDSRHEVQVAWEFVRSGVLTVATLSDRDMPDLETLMRRYRDRPMDFAGATLVHLAEREARTRRRWSDLTPEQFGALDPVRSAGFKLEVQARPVHETQ
jgi:hypothetical protein